MLLMMIANVDITKQLCDESTDTLRLIVKIEGFENLVLTQSCTLVQS